MVLDRKLCLPVCCEYEAETSARLLPLAKRLFQTNVSTIQGGDSLTIRVVCLLIVYALDLNVECMQEVALLDALIKCVDKDGWTR